VDLEFTAKFERLSRSVEPVVKVLPRVLETEAVFFSVGFQTGFDGYGVELQQQRRLDDISSRSVRGCILAEEILYGQTTTAPDFFFS